jgi:hypothetical protein
MREAVSWKNLAPSSRRRAGRIQERGTTQSRKSSERRKKSSATRATARVPFTRGESAIVYCPAAWVSFASGSRTVALRMTMRSTGVSPWTGMALI